jgi:hypothetical protein
LRAQVLAAAANTISEGDLVATAVMRKQRWELAPFLGIMSAVAPGFLMSGGLSGGQARFPGWLGKNSTATKNWRLGRDLHSHMMAHTTAGKLQTLLCYLPALHYALTQPLAKNGGVRARLAQACTRRSRASHPIPARACAPAAESPAPRALTARARSCPTCALSARRASTRWSR